MRQEDLVKKLKQLDIPDVETPAHKALLRSALLSVPRKTLPEKFLTQIKQMPMLQKAASTAVAAVVLFALFASNGGAPGESVARAQAEEALNKVYTKAARFTPEQKEAVEARIQANLADSLEEAKKAADLTYLTKEEFEKEFGTETPGAAFGIKFMQVKDREGGENLKAMPMHDAVVSGHVSVSGDPASMDPETRSQIIRHRIEAGAVAGEPVGATWVGSADHAKGFFSEPLQGEIKPVSIANEAAQYLRYTNDKGATVYLGIDENDTPVFKAIKLETSGDVTKDTFIIKGNELGFPAMEIKPFDLE